MSEKLNIYFCQNMMPDLELAKRHKEKKNLKPKNNWLK